MGIKKEFPYNDNKYTTISIDNEMIDFIKEKLGNDVLWVLDKDTNELSIIKKPTSFSRALRGLGKEMWKSVDGVKYLDKERTSWEP